MTYERKITVGLDDIKALTFECKKCKARVSLSPDVMTEVPHKCPQLFCQHPWRPPDITPGYHGAVRSHFANFVDGLASIRKMIGAADASLGFGIILEFDEAEMMRK